MAVASPVVMSAVPSESLVAAPLLEATLTPLPPEPAEPDRWSTPASFELLLPVAELPPVKAFASPSFSTFASCEMTTIPPRAPPADPPPRCRTFVRDRLPVAEASPVETVASPSELFSPHRRSR